MVNKGDAGRGGEVSLEMSPNESVWSTEVDIVWSSKFVSVSWFLSSECEEGEATDCVSIF